MPGQVGVPGPVTVVTLDASGKPTFTVNYYINTRKENFNETINHNQINSYEHSDSVSAEALVPFLQTLVRQLEHLQQNVIAVTTPLRSAPYANGSTYIKDVSFSSGTAKVLNHYLGRPYAGWRVLRPRTASPVVYETPNTSADLNKLQLTLMPGATFTADVEIF